MSYHEPKALLRHTSRRRRVPVESTISYTGMSVGRGSGTGDQALQTSWEET